MLMLALKTVTSGVSMMILLTVRYPMALMTDVWDVYNYLGG
jgi:hypothetical protein